MARFEERIKVYERTYGVVAKFDNDKDANDFLRARPDTGLIAEEGGWRYIALLADKGLKA